ncbi:MAG: hypothetical protein FJZ87_15420 [Chloroflexi bacterium]|nr:hypothetical protein [Chloroflexota bacterium]
MPRIRIILSIPILTLACLAGKTGVRPDSTGKEMPLPAFPPARPTVDDECLPITSKILEENISALRAEDIVGWLSEGYGDDPAIYLATYQVTGNEIRAPRFEPVPLNLQDEQADGEAHRRIWEYFSNLIPLNHRVILTEFMVMTDGRDNILASVAQTRENPRRWSLEVDIQDSQNASLLTFTLIHEFAHLLTLGPAQVPPSEAVFHHPLDGEAYRSEVSACPNYFPGEGCAKSGSYINHFYRQWGVNIYDEWNVIHLEPEDERYYEKLDRFYRRHRDQFLTDYSVVHPAEDIAEAFTFFILETAPSGDAISEQKILFFYEFPELTNLRLTIRSNLCRLFSPLHEPAHP